MGFISKKRNRMSHKGNTVKEISSEIVEIFEEKLEKLNITLPGIIKNNDDKDRRIKSELRNELISEVEEFINANKNVLIKKIA